MDLDLVDDWPDLGVGEEILEAGYGPVGDSNRSGFPRCIKGLHGSPHGLEVFCQFFIDDVLVLPLVLAATHFVQRHVHTFPSVPSFGVLSSFFSATKGQ